MTFLPFSVHFAYINESKYNQFIVLFSSVLASFDRDASDACFCIYKKMELISGALMFILAYNIQIVLRLLLYCYQITQMQYYNDDKTFLNKYPKIVNGSDEYKIIEFKLQLALGTSSVVIKDIRRIQNTHLSAAFTSNTNGIILQSFQMADKLNQSNKLEKVCQKGYEFSEIGMVFTIGFSQIKDTKKQMTCIMNKISVGKSYCYEASKFFAEPIKCKEGFESIYLYNEQENPQVFKHDYVVFKNHQVLPVYLIDFNVDTSKEQQSKFPLCQNCNKSPPEPAKMWCLTESAYFCGECDTDYHNSKVGGKHQRVDLSQKPKKFGMCPIHQNMELDLYCNVCSEALCVDCKITGNHQSGEMGKHLLIKLKDAYSQISSKVKEIDPNIQRRKNQLTDDLSQIDLKIKEINSKATLIQVQLYSKFKKALKELETQTQTKLSFLISDQLELKRQYDHILWMDGFIKHQLQIQEASDFLNSWYKFSKYKKEVLSLSNLSINTEVKADMKLQGDIRVTVQGKSSKRGDQNNLFAEKQMMNLSEMMMTPQKDQGKSAADRQRQLGSTQLRKTIFKKHYTQKMKDMGEQPTMVKGSMPSIRGSIDQLK